METKWKIPGCLWSGYCRADRHRQNEIGWERQSTVQKGKSVDLINQNDFLMSYHLEICFRCVTSSQQWLQTSRGQWSWRSWGRETSLRLSSRWVVNENIVHTILKNILTILVYKKNQLLQFLEFHLFSALLMWGPFNCQRESFLLCGLPVSYA